MRIRRWQWWHQVADKHNDDLYKFSIYSKRQSSISWYFPCHVSSVDIDFAFEINNGNVNHSYYRFFLYMSEASRLLPHIHIHIQLVEQQRKSVELNKLGRHRCLHSLDVVMEEKERQNFCTQRKRDEENEFSIISCCC
jgi:hypothetical protein